MICSNHFGHKARVVLGIEAGRNAREVTMAVAFLMFLGVISWGIASLAMNATRAGLLTLFLG